MSVFYRDPAYPIMSVVTPEGEHPQPSLKDTSIRTMIIGRNYQAQIKGASSLPGGVSSFLGVPQLINGMDLLPSGVVQGLAPSDAIPVESDGEGTSFGIVLEDISGAGFGNYPPLTSSASWTFNLWGYVYADGVSDWMYYNQVPHDGSQDLVTSKGAVAGITVQIRDTLGHENETVTDSNGRFEITDYSIGATKYYVRAIDKTNRYATDGRFAPAPWFSTNSDWVAIESNPSIDDRPREGFNGQPIRYDLFIGGNSTLLYTGPIPLLVPVAGPRSGAGKLGAVNSGITVTTDIKRVTTVSPTVMSPVSFPDAIFGRPYSEKVFLLYSPNDPDNVPTEQLYFFWESSPFPIGIVPAIMAESDSIEGYTARYGTRVCSLTISGTPYQYFNGAPATDIVNYTILINCVDSMGRSGNFAIPLRCIPGTMTDNLGPSIECISHPTNYARIPLDTDLTITVKVTDRGRGDSGVSVITIGGQVPDIVSCSGRNEIVTSIDYTNFLVAGTNTIDIVAKDDSIAKNETTYKLYLIHGGTDPEAPVLTINAPGEDGLSTTDTDTFTITGTVSDAGRGDAGIAEVRVNNTLVPNSVADGADVLDISFDLMVPVGVTTVEIAAKDKTGNAVSITRTITRNDTDPPSLVVMSPSDIVPVTVPNSTTQYTLTGYASDSGHGSSGVFGIYIDNELSPEVGVGGNATLSFEIIRPLVVGLNTFIITAKDMAYNTSEEVTRNVIRQA